jgi:hypothetical protein
VDRFVLQLFQDEAELQCRFIIRAARDLDIAFAEEDIEGIWYCLQAVLISAANLSRLFWSDESDQVKQAKVRAERQPLRRSLQVTQKSPLYSRKVRNAFEHFDDRVSRWAKRGPRIWMGRNIGPPDTFRISGMPDVPRFGHFDPETGILTFWTQSSNVRDIIVEAKRILPLAVAELGKSQ